MARGQHRYRHRRLLGEKKIQATAKEHNAPLTVKETARRAGRMQSLGKAQLAAGKPLSAAVQSWLSRQTGKPFTKLNAEAVAKALG